MENPAIVDGSCRFEKKQLAVARLKQLKAGLGAMAVGWPSRCYPRNAVSIALQRPPEEWSIGSAHGILLVARHIAMQGTFGSGLLNMSSASSHSK